MLSFTDKSNRLGELGSVVSRQVLPTVYTSGRGALAELPSIVAKLGTHPAIVHGDTGWQQVQAGVLVALPEGANPADHLLYYHGYCTQADINRYADRLRVAEYDVVIAVGGGKVLDLAKGAAHTAGLTCVTVPTSPATCAAIAPLSVVYGERGEVLGVLGFPQAFAAAVVDTDIIGRAPARLLASGILDALAKWHEVRLSQKKHGRLDAPISAALTLCEGMKATFDEHAQTAIDDARANRESDTRRLVAETAVLLPGLMSGLAGNGTRIAASHPVHDALTFIDSSHKSLHGELVGFGILSEMVLDNQPDEMVKQVARGFQNLGHPAGLAALGVPEALTDKADAVAERVLVDPFFQQVFTGVTHEDVKAAIAHADALACEVAQVAS
jgi:glycerol dehydrogenase